MKKTRYSASEPTGARTLAGVLKLLGVDVTKEVKAERQRQLDEQNKIRRGNLRVTITKELKSLQGHISDLRECGSDIPTEIVFDASVQLAPWLEEEK